MQNKNIKAIVVKSTDYKEFDKFLKLLTEDGEILSAAIKGVKKPTARLKFAAQVFSFCEYNLACGKGMFNVIGAKQIESLFALAYDPDTYSASSICLETSDYLSKAQVGERLFTEILKCYNAMLHKDKCPFAAATMFIYCSLTLGGYIEMPLAIKNYTYDNIPLKGESTTSLKALQHAIKILEEKLAVIVYSKITLYE